MNILNNKLGILKKFLLEKTTFTLVGLIFISFTFTITSCIDLEFDEPPVEGEVVNIQANTTIADLKKKAVSGLVTTITEDIVIQGVVVADDRSGNFFRSIILQDETAGIEVLINLTSAYNFYPIGRQLFIRCKDLVLTRDNDGVQLGGYIYEENGRQNIGDINRVNDFIVKGTRVGAPAPKVKTIAGLGVDDINTLVLIENLQFTSEEFGQTLSDPIGLRTINRNMEDCNENKVVLRTSGFAIFAGEKVPEGKGTVTAIYSVFGSTKQLFIREFADLALAGERCKAAGPTGGGAAISVKDLRALYKGQTIKAPNNTSVTGVVISDKDGKNLTSRNLIIQQAEAGIVIRFTSDPVFVLGDSILVDISGQEISEFNGWLQLNNIPNAAAKKVGQGVLPKPRKATISEIKANLNNWESTLVSVENASITGAATYSGTLKITDASGNISTFTRNDAIFASSPVPSAKVTVTGIVSEFNEPQITLRNLADVK